MARSRVAAVLSLLAITQAHVLHETVYGVYILSREGDRTPIVKGPTTLTQLGHEQLLARGEYYRRRYIAEDAPFRINGIADDEPDLSQLSVTIASDRVLQSSASSFLQGLYPTGTNQTQGNSTTSSGSGNAFQLAPVTVLGRATLGSDPAWLQAPSDCNAAQASSREYTSSEVFARLSASSQPFYDSLAPVMSGPFVGDDLGYQNAYRIFDYVNAATLHNNSLPSSELLDDQAMLQLQTLADQHELGLAYSASNEVRGIRGMQLAAAVWDHLGRSVSSSSDVPILALQFSTHETFLAFFGLAQLLAASDDFYGLPAYASSMSFELFAAGNRTTAPPIDELQVRFFFHNGTAAQSVEPVQYPLFGSSEFVMSWTDFAHKMTNVSVSTSAQWCAVCEEEGGRCSALSASDGRSTGSRGSGGLSNAVAGVIGALVTIGVGIAVITLVSVFGGFRLVKRRKDGQASHAQSKASSISETSKET